MNHEPGVQSFLETPITTNKYKRGLPNTQTQLKIMAEETDYLQQRVSPQRTNYMQTSIRDQNSHFASPKPTVPDYSLVDDEISKTVESRSLHPEDNLDYQPPNAVAADSLFKVRESGNDVNKFNSFSKSSSTSVLPKFQNYSNSQNMNNFQQNQSHHQTPHQNPNSNPSTPTHQNPRRKTTSGHTPAQQHPSPTSSRKGEIKASRAEFKHLIQENLNQSDNIRTTKDNIKILQKTIAGQQSLINQLVNQVSENNRQMEHMRVELLDKVETITDLQRELIETVSGKNMDRVTKVLQNVEVQTLSLYRGQASTQTETVKIVENGRDFVQKMVQNGNFVQDFRQNHDNFEKNYSQAQQQALLQQQSFTPSAITDQCTMTSNQSPELGDSATNYQHRVEEQKSLARQREEILAQQEYDEEEDRMYSEMITEVKQANGRGGPDSTTASSVSNLDEITPVKADQINVLNDENTDPNLVEQRTVSFHSEKSSRNEKSTKYEKITNNQENNVDVYSEKSSSEKITRESENGQISEEMVRLERTRQQLETLGIQLDPLTGNVVMPNRHVSRLKGPSPDFMQAFPAQNNLSMHANAIAMKYNSDQQINQKLAEGQGKGANVQQKVRIGLEWLQFEFERNNGAKTQKAQKSAKYGILFKRLPPPEKRLHKMLKKP